MHKTMRGNKIYIDRVMKRHLGIKNDDQDYEIYVRKIRDGVLLMPSLRDGKNVFKVNHTTNNLYLRRDIAQILKGDTEDICILFRNNGTIKLKKFEER